MNQAWERIADCLRGEIGEYGRLLQLFEEQQSLIFARDADGVLQTSHTIQAQVDTLNTCRLFREQAISGFATDHGQPAGATLRSLLPFLAPEVRPLFEALIADVNRLIHRVRRGSRLNHRLLVNTVGCHQELLRRLRPDAFTKTYAPDGRVSVSMVRPVPAMQTAG